MSALALPTRQAINRYAVARAEQFRTLEARRLRQARYAAIVAAGARDLYLTVQNNRIDHCPDCQAWRWDQHCRTCTRRATT